MSKLIHALSATQPIRKLVQSTISLNMDKLKVQLCWNRKFVDS